MVEALRRWWHPRIPADVAALAVVLIGVGVRVWLWLLDRPLWLDEQMISMNIRDRGFVELTGPLGDNQAAPLGWLWAQWLVTQPLGTGERALRLIPLLFGIGTLVAGWLVGRRFLGSVGTTTFVALLAVNPALLRYSNEVKHYSSDVFWVLVLIGAGAWVTQAPGAWRRHALWWALAAVASLCSIAAILAIPALALVLVGSALLREGWRAGVRAAPGGLGWLAVVGLHYQLSLRYTLNNPYMISFWESIGFPPKSAGPRGLAYWTVNQLDALSDDPLWVMRSGWVPWSLLLWALVGVGFVVAARRRLEFGLLLAVPLASAVLFAMLRLAPLAVRLALWLVPATFLAIAVAVQAAGSLAVAAHQRRDPVVRRIATAAVAGVVAVGLAAAFAVPAAPALTGRAPAVDDRASIEYLVDQHRPGDLTVFVASSVRAKQWYAPRQLTPAAVAVPAAPGPGCDPADLARQTSGFRRVLVYSGLRYHPYGNAHLLMKSRLSGLGRLVAERTFGTGESVVYVFELGTGTPQPAGSDDVGTGRLSCVQLITR